MFYDVKLDTYFNLNPTQASIEFEKSEDPEYLDHAYGIEDDVLQIGMWATNYEEGISYYAVIMAHDSAKHWRDDPLAKKNKLYTLSHLIIPAITMLLGYLLKFYSIFVGIMVNVIGTGIIIYFIWVKIQWKNRVKTRFKDLFGNTGIKLSQKKIAEYSKSSFPDIAAYSVLQGFAILIQIIGWVAVFSKG